MQVHLAIRAGAAHAADESVHTGRALPHGPASSAELAHHLGQWCRKNPGTVMTLARVAEVPREWMRRALDEPCLLSRAQWNELAQAAQVRSAQDLKDMPGVMARLSRAAVRRKPSAVLQQRRQAALARVVGVLGESRVAAMTRTSRREVREIALQLKPLLAARARTLEERLLLPAGWLDRDEGVPEQLAPRSGLRLVAAC